MDLGKMFWAYVILYFQGLNFLLEHQEEDEVGPDFIDTHNLNDSFVDLIRDLRTEPEDFYYEFDYNQDVAEIEVDCLNEHILSDNSDILDFDDLISLDDDYSKSLDDDDLRSLFDDDDSESSDDDDSRIFDELIDVDVDDEWLARYYAVMPTFYIIVRNLPLKN